MDLKRLMLIGTLATASLRGDLTEDLSELSNDHSQFAFSLYPAVNTAEDNCLFSPHSIASCLEMVYLGARGETETQMQKALHLSVDRRLIGKTSIALSQSLLPKKSDDKSYQMNIANALWVDQGTFLLTDFRYAIEQQFKAKLGKISFSQKETALSTINNWVSTQTEGHINTLLTPDDIDPMTKLVLLSAVYFKGQWSFPFSPTATQDWPFHPTPDTSINAKMMHQTLTLPYFENEILQAAAIPFVGTPANDGQLALVFLLPKSAENFSLLCNELPDEFNNWLKALTPKKIDLKFPKFTHTSRLDLAHGLEQLGMEDPFDSDANFAGIDGLRNLFLNKVIHEAFFALDENGVTASAATAATMNAKSVLEKEPPISLIADHPFLFFIVELKSQELLFMGKLAKPSVSE
jgi:serpin B